MLRALVPRLLGALDRALDRGAQRLRRALALRLLGVCDRALDTGAHRLGAGHPRQIVEVGRVLWQRLREDRNAADSTRSGEGFLAAGIAASAFLGVVIVVASDGDARERIALPQLTRNRKEVVGIECDRHRQAGRLVHGCRGRSAFGDTQRRRVVRRTKQEEQAGFSAAAQVSFLRAAAGRRFRQDTLHVPKFAAAVVHRQNDRPIR
ncbi:MAG TPA: hypothetical protein VNK91_11270, partial [Burkholderiaceae bacterium]|nr:hypothetical protein [Burkholderiaceae bacterium]